MTFIDEADAIFGWMSRAELQWLHDTALTHKRVAELGIYNGRSTWALAASGSTINAIDTWGDGAIHKFFLEKFDTHIKNGVVVPYHGTSVKAAAELTGLFDFVFIDADHEYESVKADILSWYPKVAKGGIIGGHDFHNGWPGVDKAVSEIFGDKVKRGPDAIWYIEVN